MASRLTANEDKLGTIHDLTAEYCLRRLKQALEGESEPLAPSELSAITKFLKDNGIECTKQDMEERFGPVLLKNAPDYEQIAADYN